jgi:pimeloyl-ACP methyl ester carboxylesterase
MHKDYVVLLHGLGRSSWSFNNMADYLQNKGYQVVNIDYPSMKYDIQTLCEKVINPEIEEKCTEKDKKINFVTHSMGGIVSRYYIKQYRPKNVGRVVMLAPPNQGSEVVDFLKESCIVTSIMGPSFEQLSTDPSSFVNMLGDPDFEVGIIAGDISFNFITSTIIPGEDDGKVSVDRSKLNNIKDFMVVDRTHTFMMDAPEVMEAVANFLETGKFIKQNG